MADITTDQQFLGTDPEVLGLQRQRQLANLLTGQAFNQPQGQMISGHYVAPSGLQQALPMINAAIGGLTNANLDNKQQELAAALRGKQAQVMQAWQQAKTPQEKFTIGTSQYAPKELQAATYEMLKPQKLGEGETISQMNFSTNTYEPMAQGGQKIDPDTRRAMQFLRINKPIDQLNDQELQAVENKALQYKRAGATNVNVNTGQHGFDNTLKLSDKFTAEPIYKAFQEVKQAHRQVNESLNLNSAVGDVAAATKIAKMLDPTSVVRETELATIANATGLTDRLSQLTEKVLTGKTLGPDQRNEFRQLSAKFYDVAGSQYNEARNKYSQIGQKNKLEDVETALGAPYKPVSNGWGKATVEGKK